VVHDRDEHKPEHHAGDGGFQKSDAQLSQECRNGSSNSSHSHKFIPQTFCLSVKPFGEQPGHRRLRSGPEGMGLSGTMPIISQLRAFSTLFFTRMKNQSELEQLGARTGQEGRLAPT
jgi:hypothetical protein